ncbi:Cysteine rich receptor like kinase, partial [Quillaja saponaria]
MAESSNIFLMIFLFMATRALLVTSEAPQVLSEYLKNCLQKLSKICGDEVFYATFFGKSTVSNNCCISLVKDLGILFKADQLRVNRDEYRYGLVQCTRDISKSDCSICLGELLENIRNCCLGKRGWHISAPSCRVRYEYTLFYRQPLASSQPSALAPHPQPNDKGETGKNTAKIAIITFSSIAAVAALSTAVYFSCFARKRRRGGGETSHEILIHNLEGSRRRKSMEIDWHAGDQTSGEMQYFDLQTVKIATNNFADVNKLGEGGFGPVYKGKLSDGKEIAVKRLSMRSRQGLEEFKNEVTLIAKLQHRNLVRLLGCCLEGDEKLLVYEYLANTSLDAFLFDPKKSQVLDWTKRVNIVNGVARGLLYLHEDSRLKIIHRDMKASNILLDNEMNPKISDFGTARIFGGNQIEANTDRVVGTYGYMAPEYALQGLFSVKSDIYSFGVLMLEMISGKKNRHFYSPEHPESLVLQAWRQWKEGRTQELIDQDLVNRCPISEALRWIHIALLCTQEDPNDRPTMSSVVVMLRSKSMNLPQPSTSPFSLVK